MQVPLHTGSAHSGGGRRRRSIRTLLLISVALGLAVLSTLPLSIERPSHDIAIARVCVDIKSFETAIAMFKTDFGVEPPSRIVLYEAAGGVDPSWSIDTARPGELTRSKARVRRLWPQFDFAIDRDLNGDGDAVDVFELNGAECLTFFLGGADLINSTSRFVEQPVPTGFSKNPRDPFEPGTGTRIGPFLEFDLTRFADVDRDGVLEYRPPLPEVTMPYLYLSSNEGKGYEPALDSDIDGDGQPDLALQIDVDDDGQADRRVAGVYLQQAGDVARPGATDVVWNANSYQIIAAGIDDDYGAPGVVAREGGLSFPLPAGLTVLNGDQSSDNLTNFSMDELGR